MRYNSTMPPKTILVAEDSHELAETIQDLLVMHGYRALIALSGKEAIELAETEHPDLILLDIRLPDISGYEVFYEVRNASWGNAIPFMILTASESIDVIAKNIAVPVEHILFKPRTSIPDLITKIEALLSSPAQAEG